MVTEAKLEGDAIRTTKLGHLKWAGYVSRKSHVLLETNVHTARARDTELTPVERLLRSLRPILG